MILDLIDSYLQLRRQASIIYHEKKYKYLVTSFKLTKGWELLLGYEEKEELYESINKTGNTINSFREYESVQNIECIGFSTAPFWPYNTTFCGSLNSRYAWQHSEQYNSTNIDQKIDWKGTYLEFGFPVDFGIGGLKLVYSRANYNDMTYQKSENNQGVAVVETRDFDIGIQLWNSESVYIPLDYKYRDFKREIDIHNDSGVPVFNSEQFIVESKFKFGLGLYTTDTLWGFEHLLSTKTKTDDITSVYSEKEEIERVETRITYIPNWKNFEGSRLTVSIWEQTQNFKPQSSDWIKDYNEKGLTLSFSFKFTGKQLKEGQEKVMNPAGQ